MTLSIHPGPCYVAVTGPLTPAIDPFLGVLGAFLLELSLEPVWSPDRVRVGVGVGVREGEVRLGLGSGLGSGL